MATEFAQRVRELFDGAVERPEAERLRFVERECAGDLSLFEAVQRLLGARSASELFLQTEARPSQRIGRYLIRSELGRGAMGVVYDAIDPVIGRSVAVKVINLKMLTAPGEADFLRERLFREARSAGQLFHPGIVIILDVGQEGDSAFIAMERVQGSTLEQLLSAGRMLETRQALKILRQTAAALDYAHQHGIVHRDIKPANIMLHDDFGVKVADFGIAKVMSTQQATVTGVVMGTPSYMSPEQIAARPVDGRSDQFSLAVLAYELLTGAKPFRADSMATLAHLIVYGERPLACASNPMLPPGVEEVFERGLSKLPAGRFASCADFVAALEAILATQSPAEKSNSKRPGKRISKLWVYLATIVTIAALAAVGFLVYLNPYRFPEPEVLVKSSPPRAPAEQVLPYPGSFHPEVSMPLRAKPVPPAIRGRQLYKAAMAKCLNGDREGSASLFRQAAELGDGGAMVELGEIYRAGDGVDQDDTTALSWFRRAADADNSSAMVFVGAMYLLGEGADENDETAALWFQKAVDRGNAAGMFDLAAMYEKGQGVNRNLEKAEELYRRSAGLGNSEAQRRVAQLQPHKK